MPPEILDLLPPEFRPEMADPAAVGFLAFLLVVGFLLMLLPPPKRPPRC